MLGPSPVSSRRDPLERSQDWRTWPQLALSAGAEGAQESLVAASAVTVHYLLITA
jgi:hypothetical protein